MASGLWVRLLSLSSVVCCAGVPAGRRWVGDDRGDVFCASIAFTSSCSDLSAISIIEPQSEVSLRFAIVPTAEVPPRALGFTPSWEAFVAAATLRGYLDELDGDVFLALLAYNIGPRNGGLRAIMTQYGARDFVTIQPYLQHLPRDYPIRVLSAALAYRLWRSGGLLRRYEDGSNAQHIQNVGIPV